MGARPADVRRLIVERLGLLVDVDGLLYTPSSERHELVGRPVAMTWGRAVVIRLIESSAKSITLRVQEWSERKGRLFTQDHVQRAIERLDQYTATASSGRPGESTSVQTAE